MSERGLMRPQACSGLRYQDDLFAFLQRPHVGSAKTKSAPGRDENRIERVAGGKNWATLTRTMPPRHRLGFPNRSVWREEHC